MNVLIHSLIFKPDGVSTAYLYADLAAELKKKGHNIKVLTTTPHFNIVREQLNRQPLKKQWGGLYYTSVFDKDIKVYHVPLKKSKSTSVRLFSFIKFHFLCLLIGLRLKNVDVILSPSPPLTIGVISWMIAIAKGAKAIYNVQEIYPDFMINQGILKNRFVIKILKALEKFVYSSNHAIVTIDYKFSDIIKHRIRDKSKLHVIHNFVDTELYKPLPRHNSFSKKYDLDNKFVVAYAGNIGYAQDWEPILQAAPKLIHLPIVFLIIGDGVRRDWFAEQVNKLQLHNILLLPYQDRENMPYINATGDIHTIVMNPESSNDGFPSKIYTIMSCAKQAIVVTGSESPLARFMKEADYGIVLTCNDSNLYSKAIIEAYENKELLARKGEKARQYILDNYSKEIIGKEYSDLINRL